MSFADQEGEVIDQLSQYVSSPAFTAILEVLGKGDMDIFHSGIALSTPLPIYQRFLLGYLLSAIILSQCLRY